MEAWAPSHLAEGYDNVGLIIGDPKQPVTKVLVALDATNAVVEEAVLGGYDCIITHHPLIFTPIKQIVTTNGIGRKVLTLAKNSISLFCAHTNLDKAYGGVNDCLVKKLGAKNVVPLETAKGNADTNQFFGIGYVWTLDKEIKFEDLAQHAKNVLQLPSVRCCGDLNKKVSKVAICCGSGMSFSNLAMQAKCDVLITGDVKYNDALTLHDDGLFTIDITHYFSEVAIVDAIVDKLRKHANNENIDIIIDATRTDGQVLFL